MGLQLVFVSVLLASSTFFRRSDGLKQKQTHPASVRQRVSRLTDIFLEVERESCSIVALQLESELPKYQLDIVSSALSEDCTANSIRASLHSCALNSTSPLCPNISSCSQSSFHENVAKLDVLGTAPFAGLLVINSTCSSRAFTNVALTKLQPAAVHSGARRLLTSSPGGQSSNGSSAPTSAFTASPAAAQAPYKQASSLGPGVNVACCCHDSLFPNAPNGQFCCCSGAGKSDACCSTGNSFCEQENCTAIMVGSLLIGSVVISSCFVAFWFFRVRTLRHHVNALQLEASMSQGGTRRRRRQREPQISMRPVKCRKPDPADEGLVRECPICIEEITANKQWVVFPCDHGTCETCHAKLLQRPASACNCPLCRYKLVEPIPGAAPINSVTPIIVVDPNSRSLGSRSAVLAANVPPQEASEPVIHPAHHITAEQGLAADHGAESLETLRGTSWPPAAGEQPEASQAVPHRQAEGGMVDMITEPAPHAEHEAEQQGGSLSADASSGPDRLPRGNKES